MAIGTAAALAIGAGVSGVAGMASANKAAKAQTEAAEKSADTSLAAAKYQADLALQGQRESIAAQNAALERQIALTEPLRTSGLNALAEMQSLADEGFNPTGFTADPGYQFQLSEGQSALDALSASRGISRSGAAMKDALRFSQGLADQEYSDWYAREANEYANQYNMLAGIANIGSGAQAQQIGAIQSNADNTSNALMNGYLSAGAANTAGANAASSAYLASGDARASGYQNSNNALQGMLGDFSGMLGMYQGGYFDNQKSMSGLFGGGQQIGWG